MSIIYDALQKTQRNRSLSRDNHLHHQDHVAHRMRWVDKGLLTAVVLLSGFVIYAYGPIVINHLKQPVVAKPVVAAAPAPSTQLVTQAAPADLVLNGVLMSDQNQTAVINNQFYHVGDVVGGMRIVAIELNNVKLQDGNKITWLKTNS